MLHCTNLSKCETSPITLEIIQHKLLENYYKDILKLFDTDGQ